MMRDKLNFIKWWYGKRCLMRIPLSPLGMVRLVERQKPGRLHTAIYWRKKFLNEYKSLE